MCIGLLLRVLTHIDCLVCALVYGFILALMIKGQAAQLCKRLVAPEAMVVPTMPGQLACFLGVMCWISMMAPKKRKCSKGAPGEDDEEPVAMPKAKAKAKAANAKSKAQGGALDCKALKVIKARIDYAYKCGTPEAIADAAAAEKTYAEADRDTQRDILAAVEGSKGLKFIPQLVTKKHDSIKDIRDGIDDWVDRFEIYRHKPMPEDQMKVYLSHLPQRPHYDPVMISMNEPLYHFVYKSANRTREEEGQTRELVCSSTNLTAKGLNMLTDALPDAEGLPSSTKASKDVVIIACPDWTAMNHSVKQTTSTKNQLGNEVSACGILLATLKNHSKPEASEEYTKREGEFKEAQKLLDDITNQIGICKAVDCKDEEGSKAATKDLKAQRSLAIVALQQMKEAKTDVKAFLQKLDKAKVVE